MSKAYRVWIYYRPTRDIADADKLEKRLANKDRSDAASVRSGRPGLRYLCERNLR